MKRFAVALALLLLFIMGCTAPKNRTSDGEVLVVASFHPVELLAAHLLHDLPGFEIRTVAPASAGCMHHYSLTPGDLALLRRADVIIGEGYGTDPFLFTDELRRANPGAHYIELSRSDPDLEDHLEAEDSHGHDDHHSGETPHAWVSPFRVAKHAQLLTDSLAAAFPAYSDSIEVRGHRVAAQLLGVHERYRELVNAAGNKQVAAMHTSFDVLAEDIGLDMVMVVQADPVAAPGPRTLERVIRELKDGDIAILLSEPQMVGELEQTLAEQAGIELVHLHTGVGTEFEGGLVALHEENLRTLTGALQGER